MRARLSALVQREFLRVRPKGVPSGRRKTAVAVRHFCWRPPAQVMRPSSQSPSTRSHSMSTGPSHGTAGAGVRRSASLTQRPRARRLQPTEVAEAYSKLMVGQQAELQRHALQYHIDYVPVDVAQGFHQVILPFLLKRSRQ